MHRTASLVVLCASAATAAAFDDVRTQADRFLERFNTEYARLYYAQNLAEWESNTRIIEGDDTNAKRTRQATEAAAAFTGSVENIETCRKLLAKRDKLTPLQVKQLEAVLYLAANNPQTVPDLVRERIALETDQVEKLYGFTYRIDGKEVTTNRIDETLRTETDLAIRLKTWNASKEVGRVLRAGLIQELFPLGGIQVHGAPEQLTDPFVGITHVLAVASLRLAAATLAQTANRRWPSLSTHPAHRRSPS